MHAALTLLPPHVAVFALAVTPLLGHGAIPAGIVYYKLSVWATFLLTELGYAVAAIAVYAAGDLFVAWKEKREGRLRRWLETALHHAHAKVHRNVGTVGLIGLAAFVALPVPGAGVWTGTLGAYLMDIPFRKAAPYILAGNVINGIVTLLATDGSVALLRHLF